MFILQFFIKVLLTNTIVHTWIVAEGKRAVSTTYKTIQMVQITRCEASSKLLVAEGK